MSLSKPLTLRHLCHLLNKILGLFYHRHIVFFTISWVKNTKCYLPKKSAFEWPRNKLSATTCQVPQNGYNNFLIGFFHTETNLKCSWPSWESIHAPVGYVHHSLDHYTAVPIAEQPHFFHSTYYCFPCAQNHAPVTKIPSRQTNATDCEQ